MQAVTRFGLANTFQSHEESSFAKIAAACELSESVVRRILRHAMTKQLFEEPRKGIVVHTAASRLLAEDQQIHDWVWMTTCEMWQAAAHTVNALVKYPEAQEPNQTGFSLANNTDLSVYKFFNQAPDRAKRFGNAMATFSTGTGFELDHLVHGFDWRSIGRGTVVDVRGITLIS